MIGRLNGWVKVIISNLPDLALAILFVLLFNFISRYVRKFLVRSLNRISDNSGLTNLTGTVSQLVIMSVGVFSALGVLGLDKTVTSLLAGAGVVALAVGFAFQDLTANFISGIFIALQQPIRVGDVVDTNGYQGRVISIKLRSIVLDNFSGQTIEIPSKDVFQKPITNYTRSGERRIELTAGVSYADDLDKAQQVASDAIRALPFVQSDKPFQVYYRTFTNEMIQFTVGFWIDSTQTDSGQALSEAVKTLKKAFDDNDILMLFAPQTFDLKQRVRQEHTSQPQA